MLKKFKKNVTSTKKKGLKKLFCERGDGLGLVLTIVVVVLNVSGLGAKAVLPQANMIIKASDITSKNSKSIVNGTIDAINNGTEIGNISLDKISE